MRLHAGRLISTSLVIVLFFSAAVTGQRTVPVVFNFTASPGDNYDKAEFRLWHSGVQDHIRGVVVLTPGSNGDGRGEVDDLLWQSFAREHRLALVGVRLTDKPHEQPFIEHYARAPGGSGQALLDALMAFAGQAGHPELAAAPLLLWGMSAGGQFNYEFVNWKPERVIAFVVNKGGIYYTALSSAAARRVPGLLFIGGMDSEQRIQTITGLFALNRRAGALWGLAEEPGAAHVVGRSRELALVFFEDVLLLRQPESTGTLLQPIAENSGYLGDRKTQSTWKYGEATSPVYPVSWLPTRRTALAWEALVTGRPFAR